MLFQSPAFLPFLLITLLLLTALRGRTQRHVILLLASYMFYAAWDIRFLSLLLLSTGVDFVVGLQLARTNDPRVRRRWLLLSLVTGLGLLGTFKYFDFFAHSAANLAAAFGVHLDAPTLGVVLPVGISFYTFQSLSYTIDVYRRRIASEPSLLRFALYIAIFPQLVAGPIVRAGVFLPQLRRDRPPRLRDLPAGALLFTIGLFKKIVIADHLGLIADPLFDTPELYGSGALSLGVLAYAAQIYCDFGGYSDMAIGLGRILGYRLPRNFNSPYAARSPREFWQRWHISFSTWLRDYLYIPLGGNRGGRTRATFNLMSTMLLGGLWHGANWTFLIWGLLHGTAVAVDRAIGPSRRRGDNGNMWSWILTISTVLLAWIFFRARTPNDAAIYLTSLFSLKSPVETIDPEALMLALLLIAITALGQMPRAQHWERQTRRWGSGRKLLLAGFLFGLAYSLSPGENRAFIYFQF